MREGNKVRGQPVFLHDLTSLKSRWEWGKVLGGLNFTGRQEAEEEK